MILPIVAYGSNILKVKATDVDTQDPQLKKLIADMWETMYNAEGVGLAAPQIGLAIRMFMIDTKQLDDGDGTGVNGMRQCFINAQKVEEGGKQWDYEEGCLSIPNIRGDVKRPTQIKLRYYDENFEEHEQVFNGMIARVIQHEYDHIEGKLFIDHISPLKRKLLKGKLTDITKGKITVDYKMKFHL